MIIEAGQQPKTANEYIAELYEYVGIEGFPISMQVTSDGKIVTLSIDTEWKTGGTTPVEETSVIDENGEKIYTEYAEQYEEKELTQAQIAKVNQWINKNISA